PQGIYHAVWDGAEWSPPELIYFIREEPEDNQVTEGETNASIAEAFPEGIVHAHATHAAVRLGHHLVLTFTDPPPAAERRLFVTQKSLDDLPADAPATTAGPETEASPAAVTPVTPPSPAAGTATEATGAPAASSSAGTGEAAPADNIFRLGILLPVLFVAGIFVARLLLGGRR
ncbi:MAG: hypothetical protein ACRDHL_00610, partial [Candidatus Promineifilaceae bacterium]